MNEKLLEKYLMPLSVVAAGLIIAGSIYLVGQKGGLTPTSSPNPSPTSTPNPGQLPGPDDFQKVTQEVSVAGDPVLGSSSAKVTMIEFSDFQCPYCSRFTLETFPQLKTKYIDTGKVKVIFKNFPLPGHQYAQGAAEASECAFEQGKFWEYQAKLFENQSSLDTNNLKKYAQDLGLNEQTFNSCLDSKKYTTQVKADADEGTKVGIQGTPSFIINGILVDGAYPLSVFEAVIDSKLK